MNNFKIVNDQQVKDIHHYNNITGLINCARTFCTKNSTP